MKKFTFILTALIMCFGLCSAQLKTKIDIADVIPDLNPSMSVSDIQSRYAPRLYYLGVEWSDVDKCWYLKQKSDHSSRAHMTMTMATKLARLTLAQDKPRAYYSEIYHCHGDAATRLLEMEKDTAKAREWLIQCDRLCFNRDVLASFLLNTEYFGYGGFTREEVLQAMEICDEYKNSETYKSHYDEVLREINVIHKYREAPDKFLTGRYRYLEGTFYEGECEKPSDQEFFELAKPMLGKDLGFTKLSCEYSVTNQGAQLTFGSLYETWNEPVYIPLSKKIRLVRPTKVELKHTKYPIVFADAEAKFSYDVSFVNEGCETLRLVYKKKKGWCMSYKSYTPPLLYENNKKVFDDIIAQDEKIQSIDPSTDKIVYVYLFKSMQILSSEYNVIGTIRDIFRVEVNRAL